MEVPVVLTTSGSGIGKARSCLRQLAFDKVDGIKFEGTEAQNEGKAIHAGVEDYYLTGNRDQRPESVALLDVLPERGTPRPEQDFMFVWPGVEVLVRGYIDLFDPLAKIPVYDFKTVASLSRARKREAEGFAEDPQAVVYGVAARLMGAPEDITMQWPYVSRAKSPKIHLATFDQTHAQLIDGIKALTPTVTNLVQILSKAKTANEVPANRSACYEYGPCRFRDRCAAFPKKKEVEPMDENVLAKLAAAKAKRAAEQPPAPERPVEARVYVPPKMGLLDTLRVQDTKPAISPPDAAPDVTPTDPPPPPLAKVPKKAAKAQLKADAEKALSELEGSELGPEGRLLIALARLVLA